MLTPPRKNSNLEGMKLIWLGIHADIPTGATRALSPDLVRFLSGRTLYQLPLYFTVIILGFCQTLQNLTVPNRILCVRPKQIKKCL